MTLPGATKFAADPGRVVGSADRKWPDVQSKLTP